MEINIVYWANELFTRYTLISILSILKNTKSTNRINCYLLTHKNNWRIKLLDKIESLYPNFKFYWIECEDDSIKNLKTSNICKHLNHNTYYRFFVEKLNLDKLLYLDSDTIAVSDITDLYEINNNKTIWVVSDGPTEFVKNVKKILWLNEKYFNSWMMLINLPERKKMWVWRKCIKLLNENSYPCNDQDALNIVLENQCEFLQWKFNVQTCFFEVNKSNYVSTGFDMNYYKEAVECPTIIHYTWSSKPRYLFNNHPRRRDYDKAVLYSYYIIAKISCSKNIVMLTKFCSAKEIFILSYHIIEQLLCPNPIVRWKIKWKIKSILMSIVKKNH